MGGKNTPQRGPEREPRRPIKCHKKDKNRTDSFQKGIMGGKNTPQRGPEREPRRP
ncbi:hypothetical protein DPMN_100897 [Dreissena polymorpha]|uniref:Uncharacterized protein n=1 Tax=Dreissena polymorpha TaxID=45954 RepID=A0A9D4LHX2_DREPO|nr:hypothetical protein DPMN_100897 [Dreissena polymorpha]